MLKKYLRRKINNVLSKVDLMLLTPQELRTVVQHEILHHNFVKMNEEIKNKPQALYTVVPKNNLN